MYARNGQHTRVTLLALALLIAAIAACADEGGTNDGGAPGLSGSAATATPQPDPTETPSPVPTETPTPSPTPTATPSPTPTATPSPSPTPAPTETPQPASRMNGDPAWNGAIHTPDDGFVGVVTVAEANIRAEPSDDAPVVRVTYERHTVTAYEAVAGSHDGAIWYRIGDGEFIRSDLVAPFAAPEAPEAFEGYWVDVDLTTFYAVAYDGETPVYAAIVAAGRDGRTPVGTFEVFHRVRDEIMDSATVGIPEGHPEHYYLENVLFTQYFLPGGYALHGNYWTPPEEFGGFTSNGCVGLLNHDAEVFWDLLEHGSIVHIRD